MLKRIFTLLLALIVCAPLTVTAAETFGFDDSGWTTDTTNEYYLNTDSVVTVCYNELDDAPDYGAIYAGSMMYIPIYVYANRGKTSAIATTKQITTDKVEVSSKAIVGGTYVDDISVIDGKKLKNSGLEAGAYVALPFKDIYPMLIRKRVKLTLVLSVNGVPFQDTRVTLLCNIINREEVIDKNSVYGVETPMKYIVGNKYTGEATFNFGSSIKYTTKVKAKEKYYLALDKTPDSLITSMYGTTGVYLDFYSFPGDYDKFPYEGRLEIPIDRSKLVVKSNSPSSSRGSAKSSSASSAVEPTESLYVYKISGNTLVALGGKQISFNAKTNVLSIYTNNLESYVLSNQPLKKQVDTSSQSGILKSGYAS